MRPVLEGTLSGDTFTTVNKYVWEGDSYYDPLVFAYVGGAWRYYAYDGLGSTRQLLNEAQAVTDSYSYEAFGNLLSDGGETRNPYMYVGSLGYYTTGAPSLLHLGARYYMAQIGRFGTLDPSRREPNLYGYARGRPTRVVDPAGLLGIPRPPKVYYPPADLGYEVDPMAWHLCMTCCMVLLGGQRLNKKVPGLGELVCTRYCAAQLKPPKVPGAPKDYEICWDRDLYPDTESCQDCCDEMCGTPRGGHAWRICYSNCP